MTVSRNRSRKREGTQIQQQLWVNQWEWLVAYIWGEYIVSKNHDFQLHFISLRVTLLPMGRCQNKFSSRESGCSCLVLAISRPWPTSVNINFPLKQIKRIVLTIYINTYIFLNFSRSSMSTSKSGRSSWSF